LSKLVIKNSDVERAIIGVPLNHKHVRVVLHLKNGTILVFQEATIANIVRAFIAVKTHPTMRAVELKGVSLSSRKPGYANYQLLESGRSQEEVQRELEELMKGNTCAISQ